ncbi:Uncharacterized protein Adt_34300 [Abeliophyllum distichum]|uniref:Uncharacterized protein n=1 Tax=Abeliophyllum distichum TaxID=126358 RepID=A0ABD1QZQ5_9LAMI
MWTPFSFGVVPAGKIQEFSDCGFLGGKSPVIKLKITNWLFRSEKYSLWNLRFPFLVAILGIRLLKKSIPTFTQMGDPTPNAVGLLPKPPDPVVIDGGHQPPFVHHTPSGLTPPK